MTTQTQPRRAGHEGNKVPLKPVLWCVAGFIALAVVIHLGLIGYARFLGASFRDFGRAYQVEKGKLPAYPAPALQVNPQVDLQTYRTQAEHDLNTYGWID